MYGIFGEMDSAEEINATAEGLKKEGDKESLYKLAAENGIDRCFADMYLDGTSESLCDTFTAAMGKVEAEAEGLKLVEIMEEWSKYIVSQCENDEEFARAVRRKGKSMEGCIGHLLKWSYEHMYDIPAGIKKKAGIPGNVKEGIPGTGRARQMIREYYLGKAGGKK